MDPSRLYSNYNSAYDDLDNLRERPRSEYWHADFRPADLDTPYARSALRKVCRGRFTSGPQEGCKCLIKFFNHRNQSEREYSDHNQLNNDIANYVVANWNAERKTNIRVGVTYVWEFWGDSSRRWRRKPAVVEWPYLQKYYHWNSNSGYCDTRTSWSRMAQAISHYSYSLSGGNLLVCELQGGFSRRSKTPILVTPAIASINTVGGITDLGPQGIYAFFANHTCNEFCDPRWKGISRNAARRELDNSFRRKKGTTYWDYAKNKYV